MQSFAETQARNTSTVSHSQVTATFVLDCISGVDPAVPRVTQQKAGPQIECPLHISRRSCSPTYVCNWLPVRANTRTCSQLVGSGLLVPPTIFRTPSGCSAFKKCKPLDCRMFGMMLFRLSCFQDSLQSSHTRRRVWGIVSMWWGSNARV